jgi:hypothetical protein
MESICARGDDHESHGSARHAPAGQWRSTGLALRQPAGLGYGTWGKGNGNSAGAQQLNHDVCFQEKGSCLPHTIITLSTFVFIDIVALKL